MLKANDAEEERNLFENGRYHYPDARMMRRFEILWLHANGKSVSEIGTLVRQDTRTVRKVIKNYQSSSFEEFTLRPPASANEAAARIKKLFNIDRSPERVRVFMNRISMKFRKVGAIPAQVDWDKQEEFKKSVRARNNKNKCM